MSAFGGTALSLELSEGNWHHQRRSVGKCGHGPVRDAGAATPNGHYLLRRHHPGGGLLCHLLRLGFPGGGQLASGGKLESPVPQRVFWAVLEGVVAATLLLGGGLSALQTAAISAGLPFAVVLLVMCFSIYKGLSYEHDVIHVKKALQNPRHQKASFASPWGILFQSVQLRLRLWAPMDLHPNRR
jgi:choline/glycine/proline betaine transport protein